MICRTAEDAWQAGWNAPCEHGRPLDGCDQCALTADEITRLAALHRPHLAAPETRTRAA